MTAYIREIQRQLIETYGFPEQAGRTGVPDDVPDGEYPMEIEGRVDRVRIEGGRVFCMNLDPAPPQQQQGGERDERQAN